MEWGRKLLREAKGWSEGITREEKVQAFQTKETRVA